MPSARIHEVIIKEINKDYDFDELLLRIGTIAPDSWRNIRLKHDIKNKYASHFLDFREKDNLAYNYVEFYLKYYKNLSNPFYFGYLVHLIVDKYWKKNIDKRFYKINKYGKAYKFRDGSYKKISSFFLYKDSLKMQSTLAYIYKLSDLPINREYYKHLECNIDELNLDGLFDEDGSLGYIKKDILPKNYESEIAIYDVDLIIKYINETVNFVKEELERLKQIKYDYDKKVKIAVNLNTLFDIEKLEEEFFKLFDSDNIKNINDKFCLFLLSKGMIDIIYLDYINSFDSDNYQVDLLFNNKVDESIYLKEGLVKYLNFNNIKYNYINTGFKSIEDLLENRDYNIYIGNKLDNIKLAKKLKVKTIYLEDKNLVSDLKK